MVMELWRGYGFWGYGARRLGGFYQGSVCNLSLEVSMHKVFEIWRFRTWGSNVRGFRTLWKRNLGVQNAEFRGLTHFYMSEARRALLSWISRCHTRLDGLICKSFFVSIHILITTKHLLKKKSPLQTSFNYTEDIRNGFPFTYCVKIKPSSISIH